MNRCSRSEIGISELAHCFSLISTSTILSVISFSLFLPRCLSFAPLPYAIRQLSFAVHFSTSSSFLPFPFLPPAHSRDLPSVNVASSPTVPELNVRSCIWLPVWISDLSGCNRAESGSLVQLASLRPN